MIGRDALLLAVGRIVVDDELDRIEHGDTPLGADVEIFAQAVLEHAYIDPLMRLGHADALGEKPDGFGRVSAPAQTDERWHARIVPAVDVLAFDELDQLALAHYRISKVEPGEFVLMRQRPLQQSRLRELLDHPVVERPMILEFERAERM